VPRREVLQSISAQAGAPGASAANWTEPKTHRRIFGEAVG